MPDVVVKTRVAVIPGSSTGLFNFTTSDLEGRTPKAAFFMMTNQNDAHLPSGTTSAKPNIGACDASNQWSATSTSEDNVADTDVSRGFFTDRVLQRFDNGETTGAGRANFNAFITNGVQLNVTEAFDFDVVVVVVLFAGDDLQADVGSIDLGNSTSTINFEGVGFEADLVLFGGDNGGVGSTTGNYTIMFGAAANGGGQCSISHIEQNALPSGDAALHLNADHALMQTSLTDGSVQWEILVDNFDSAGFDLTPSAATNNDFAGYLALDLGGFACHVGTFSTPTSTGVDDLTDLGTYAQAALFVLTPLTSAGVGAAEAAGAECIALGVTCIEGDEGFATTYIDPTSGTTDTASYSSSSRALYLRTLAGGAGVVDATLSAQHASGLSMNYTAADATARFGFYVAIEGDDVNAAEHRVTATWQDTIMAAVPEHRVTATWQDTLFLGVPEHRSTFTFMEVLHSVEAVRKRHPNIQWLTDPSFEDTLEAYVEHNDRD